MIEYIDLSVVDGDSGNSDMGWDDTGDTRDYWSNCTRWDPSAGTTGVEGHWCESWDLSYSRFIVQHDLDGITPQHGKAGAFLCIFDQDFVNTAGYHSGWFLGSVFEENEAGEMRPQGYFTRYDDYFMIKRVDDKLAYGRDGYDFMGPTEGCSSGQIPGYLYVQYKPNNLDVIRYTFEFHDNYLKNMHQFWDSAKYNLIDQDIDCYYQPHICPNKYVADYDQSEIEHIGFGNLANDLNEWDRDWQTHNMFGEPDYVNFNGDPWLGKGCMTNGCTTDPICNSGDGCCYECADDDDCGDDNCYNASCAPECSDTNMSRCSEGELCIGGSCTAEADACADFTSSSDYCDHDDSVCSINADCISCECVS